MASARVDLRVTLLTGAALAAVGALLGLAWARWSPPGPQGEILRGGAIAVLGESESQVAADGRFVVIAAATGLVAALGTWWGLRQHRGPVLLTGLAVGGAAGALLTDLVGRLTGGGSNSGRVYELTNGTRGEVSLRLPIEVHMHGLLLVEPAVIALVYGLLVAFAAHDDLGRPDPAGDAAREARAAHLARRDGSLVEASVDAGGYPQHGWGDGDAPGAAQQREFPA